MTSSAGDGSPGDEGPPSQLNGTEPSTTKTHPKNTDVPKTKRLACVICRKRKLKCDGARPKCSTCARLGHQCAYDEMRKKSGPKRGYVKALEERLKQVETLLQTQEPAPEATNRLLNGTGMGSVSPPVPDANLQREQPVSETTRMGLGESIGDTGMAGDFTLPIHTYNETHNWSWEMLSLGLEEPLPLQETIDELHELYFSKVHPSVPMVHKYRYLAAFNLAPAARPPVCLRYIMWAHACSVAEKYKNLGELFYRRSRKYLEMDYMKGFGEQIVSVAHVQTHILLGVHEMKMMYFPRSWMSHGQGARFSQMLGLHRVDANVLDVKQCIPPASDWTETEERRRTFWVAFCHDRYGSIGTGWPMSISEDVIQTNLPASEEAFENSRPEQTCTLRDCTHPSGASKMSAFGAVILMASLFGKNLLHLHRPVGEKEDSGSDSDGPFWRRHRELDSILVNTSLCLPDHLRLPAVMSSPNVIFINMCIHTSTICLHQAAIFMAEKHKVNSSASAESKIRCIAAANEIANIMRMISHMDMSPIHPFTAFCLYVAARVFIQYLKSQPNDSQYIGSLGFLVSAMNMVKKTNPISESFLTQLETDYSALAAKIPELRRAFTNADGSTVPFTELHFKSTDGIAKVHCLNDLKPHTKSMGSGGNSSSPPDGQRQQQNGNSSQNVCYRIGSWEGGATPLDMTNTASTNRVSSAGVSTGDRSSSKTSEGGELSNNGPTPSSSLGTGEGVTMNSNSSSNANFQQQQQQQQQGELITQSSNGSLPQHLGDGGFHTDPFAPQTTRMSNHQNSISEMLPMGMDMSDMGGMDSLFGTGDASAMTGGTAAAAAAAAATTTSANDFPMSLNLGGNEGSFDLNQSWMGGGDQASQQQHQQQRSKGQSAAGLTANAERMMNDLMNLGAMDYATWEEMHNQGMI